MSSTASRKRKEKASEAAENINVEADVGDGMDGMLDVPTSHIPIDALQQYGVSATDIKKVHEAGFSTVRSLMLYTRKDLVAVRGFSDAKVDKLLESAQKVLSDRDAGGFISGAEWCEKRKDTLHLTTSCAAIDEILNGGFETRAITEIFGEWRCGKTQLCHTLAVTTQLPIENGGGSAKVAWIDTEGTFRGERIVQIADRFGLDSAAVLENIMVARTFTNEQMTTALVQIGAKMAEEPYKLLVIDSIMAPFRVDYTGRGELSERQQRLGQFLSRLTKLADEYNVAVILTNQVQSDPGGMAFAGVEPKKPIGGHVLAHASTIRLQVRKGRAEARVLKVLQGPDLKEAEAEFQITDGGITSMDG